MDDFSRRWFHWTTLTQGLSHRAYFYLQVPVGHLELGIEFGHHEIAVP